MELDDVRVQLGAEWVLAAVLALLVLYALLDEALLP